MPTYMDVHPGLGDATPEDVAAAHRRDLEVQEKYGVRFLSWWFDDPSGKAFCLVEAPDPEAAKACHKEAHGLMPHDIIEVPRPTLDSFLGDIEKDPNDRVVIDGSVPDSGLRVIMFTDMVGSTSLSTSVGDDAAVEVLQAHDAIVRGCLADLSGREIKHTGDGILAAFRSVTSAIRAAKSIQEQAIEVDHLAVKLGMSAGEPVGRSSDLYGAAVNLAARVCDHAAGGETLVSATVRDLALGKNFEFRDRGEVPFKGFNEPVRVYELA